MIISYYSIIINLNYISVILAAVYHNSQYQMKVYSRYLMTHM